MCFTKVEIHLLPVHVNSIPPKTIELVAVIIMKLAAVLILTFSLFSPRRESETIEANE